MIQQPTHEAAAPSPRPSRDEIRAELFHMLDELATSRTVNPANFAKRFAELWNQIAPDEPTLH